MYVRLNSRNSSTNSATVAKDRTHSNCSFSVRMNRSAHPFPSGSRTKLGELTIRRMRSEAETELGTRFDIKKFHSMILGFGAVPLPELEAQVRGFIAQERAAPVTAASR